MGVAGGGLDLGVAEQLAFERREEALLLRSFAGLEAMLDEVRRRTGVEFTMRGTRPLALRQPDEEGLAELAVKRIEKAHDDGPPRLRLLSANPDCPSYTCLAQGVHTVGRVLWTVRRT